MLKLFFLELASIVCVICAAVSAIYGVNNWGWFLVIGLLLTNSDTTEKKP